MNSILKFTLALILIFILALTTKASPRPSTAQRMKSGNSNGYTMNSWYGGNNRHKCRLVRTKKRQLRY